MNEIGNESKAMSLEDEVRCAIDGDRDALETLVRALQSDIYGLALRMLCNREDAEDATQEILIRIVTHLSQFDFRSKLKTWGFRVAVNYILDVKKSPVERLHLSFESFAQDLIEGLGLEAPAETEHSLLIEEVKVGCSLGMLQCLDRPHRLAYVLGEIFEMSGPEAAEALDISPDLFRKRLQHARTAILAFTRNYCGLVSDAAACSCNRQVPAALRSGKVRADSCNFAASASSFQQARAVVRQVEEARRAFAVHQRRSQQRMHCDSPSRLSSKRDATWIATKCCDVFLHPLQRGYAIEQAVITRSVMGRFFRQFGMAEKTKSAEPVIDGDDDQTLLRQFFAIIRRHFAGAFAKSAAVNPNKHRTLFIGILCARPNVEAKAIFAHVVLHHELFRPRIARTGQHLHATVRKLVGLPDAAPLLGRLRWAPTQIAYGRCGVRDAFEYANARSRGRACQRTAFDFDLCQRGCNGTDSDQREAQKFHGWFSPLCH